MALPPPWSQPQSPPSLTGGIMGMPQPQQGPAQQQQLANNTHQIPQSIYDALTTWSQGGSPAGVRKVLKLEGWSMDGRINSIPVGVHVIDPSGSFHFIPNGSF